MKYQRIYDRMPLLGQHAMATLYGYKNKRVRFGGEYRPRLEFLRAFASLDRAEQEEYQRRELQAFVAHAATRSAFYRRLYAGVPWQKVRRVEDLALLPVVTKEQIRSNIEDVITVERSKGVRSQTGGTTGTSLEVWFTQRDYQHRMANLDHFKSLHGFHHLSMRRATFSGKHIVPQGHRTRVFWRYNHAMRQMLYSTFHLTPD
ncbi:MAG TPA: hypothetical protein VKZ63_21710, partial [Kofleriaceae bacterium]|nr:hypothetical protein [Kofleriaceae bacterium]